MRIKDFFASADEKLLASVAAEILSELEDGAAAKGGTPGAVSPVGDVRDRLYLDWRYDGGWDRRGRFSPVQGFDAVGGGGRSEAVAPADERFFESGSGRFELRKAGTRRFSGVGDVDDLIEENDLGVLTVAQEIGTSRLPERFSEVFSRDARRYDGAFERY